MPEVIGPVVTDFGVYSYQFRKKQAVIEFTPAVMFNKRRKNSSKIVGPVATLVSAKRARQHLDDVCEQHIHDIAGG